MFFDAVELSHKPQFTHDGYLVATAKVARTGIQLYKGDEVGKPDMDIVRVYRPESAVFAKDSLSTYAYKPMTFQHPSEPVTAESWKDKAVGQIGGEVMRDGDHVRVPLIMMDAAAIKEYQGGVKELSMGYDADLEWKAGTTENGEHYDAVQKNIRINHIALVPAGRAGSARIDDSKIGETGGQQNSQSQTKGALKMTHKVKFGDVTLEVSEQAAEAIIALTEQLEAAQAALAEAKKEAEKELQTAQEETDKAMAAKDAEIDKLKADSMTADKLDAAIAERVKLIGDAKRIVNLDYKGDADAIRKQAVSAIVGADKVADKSPAYIEARFDALLESAGKQTTTSDAQVADFQAAYEQKLTNAWKEA